MHLPLILLPLLFVQGYCTEAQDEANELRHIKENTEKMGKLMTRWNRLHPVTYPPLPADVEASIEQYVKEAKAAHPAQSIPELNGADAGYFIEGDIIPSDEDIADMEARLREETTGESRDKRAASDKRAKNWPIDAPIPILIYTQFTKEQKEIILAALQTFKENTCIEFEESNNSGLKLAYYPGEGCESEVGDTREKRNRHHMISLGNNCVHIQVVQHETMHALGFDHTMSRSDRDEYMYFKGDAVEDTPLMRYQFEVLEPKNFNNLSMPYEYNSVMHYPAAAGSKDKITPVLIPKKTEYTASVGGLHGPTFNDWKAVNMRYNCTERKCERRVTCFNNGYQHPRDCTRCACPTFYTGPLCENEINVTNLYSGDGPISMVYEKQLTTSPRVHADFSEFEKEIHVIKAPEGQRILITIDKIRPHAQIDCHRECVVNAVEIVVEDMTLVGRRFCCSHNETHSFVSDTNVIGYKVYSAPGVPFSSQVTFSIEPSGEVPPTIGPSTVVPSSTDSTTTSPESDSPSTTIPQTDERTSDPNEPSTTTPTSTDSTEINHTVESETTTTQFLTNGPSESSESPQPENPSSSSTEPPSSDEKSTTENPEAEQSKIGELLDSIKSLLHGVSEKVNELARKLGF